MSRTVRSSTPSGRGRQVAHSAEDRLGNVETEPRQATFQAGTRISISRGPAARRFTQPPPLRVLADCHLAASPGVTARPRHGAWLTPSVRPATDAGSAMRLARRRARLRAEWCGAKSIWPCQRLRTWALPHGEETLTTAHRADEGEDHPDLPPRRSLVASTPGRPRASKDLPGPPPLQHFSLRT